MFPLGEGWELALFELSASYKSRWNAETLRDGSKWAWWRWSCEGIRRSCVSKSFCPKQCVLCTIYIATISFPCSTAIRDDCVGPDSTFSLLWCLAWQGNNSFVVLLKILFVSVPRNSISNYYLVGFSWSHICFLLYDPCSFTWFTAYSVWLIEQLCFSGGFLDEHAKTEVVCSCSLHTAYS